ncbi:type I restriction enzyme S subunit [Marinomonas alcarazii]|uniref:Type I restriction enzyme S subunit n=1 Tax=Marinomonas alcarazii TaxID=491949 RepID=A0A318UTS8_9GAMM|nr:restriction endonuclease subunit S [Marinomonas alcarazii]PYF79902.1 type I restriction enzyme S subunit [Marinomonas alcarazii]
MSAFNCPEGWVLVEIESVLAAQSDGKFVHQGWSPQCDRESAAENEWGVLKTTAIQDGFYLDYENKRLPKDKEPKHRIEVKKGDLLITNAGPRNRCGVICYVKNTRSKLMLSGKMYRLRFPEEVICPEYIESWLRTSLIQKELDDRKTGISESGLNMTQARFLTLPIMLAPLAEQKVIADDLDTLLAKVETTKARLDRIPNILKNFRQSVLAAAVSGKLTEEWRERNNPINVTFNHINDVKQALIKSKVIKKDLDVVKSESAIGSPNDWLNLKLKSIASKITDGEHKTPKREDTGRYLLSARNVQDGYISTSNVDFVGEGEFQKLRKRCDPNKGDILISCSGSVGRVCLVDEDDKYVMVRSAALVKFMDEFIQGKYLMYYLQSPVSQKDIEESSKSTAQANLFLGPIKDLTVALPSLSEQTEIVRRVEELFAFADTIEQKTNAALERVNNLTQSILAKAFRGELTAEWRAANPDLITGDNSAEALLEKIKAERDAIKKQTKKKTQVKKAKV